MRRGRGAERGRKGVARGAIAGEQLEKAEVPTRGDGACLQLRALFSGKRHDSAFVLARSHAARLEDGVRRDPIKGLLERFLAVWLKDDSLAGAPATHVHLGMKPLGEFVQVIDVSGIPTLCGKAA